MLPTITIITPSYNQGQFIKRTIDSVLDQAIPDLEYFVIDGGSRDQTREILAAYGSRLDWVSEPDGGQAEAINKGLQRASGDIIGWLNSDDIYYPGALAAVRAFFAAHPDVQALYGDAHYIDADDRVIEPYYTEDWDYERLRSVCYLCQPAVFLRRETVAQYGLLDEGLHYCMDYEYWLRIGRNVPFVRLRRVLAGSRLHPETKTLGQRVSAHKEIVLMTRRQFGKPPVRWVFNYAHAVLDGWGVRRETAAGRARYITLLILVSSFSFLRWQHTIPREALVTMWEWLTQPPYRFLRDVLGR